MDRETRAKIRFGLILGSIVLVLAAGVIGWVYKISGLERELKTPDLVASSIQASSVPEESHKSLFAEEEEKHEAMLEQQREEQELAKKKLRKEKSNECQFWRLQEKQGKSAAASKKVEQYCVLSAEEASSKL